jgi:hypothetical protein
VKVPEELDITLGLPETTNWEETMVNARRKNEDAIMPDPLAIDPLAMIGYLGARQHLAERFGEASSPNAPTTARRSPAWRTAFAERLRAFVERAERRECDAQVCVTTR